MATKADYDCANHTCYHYHEVSRHPWHEGRRAPQCLDCRQPLRLLRIVRTMDPATRARLALAKAGAQ